MAYHRLNVAMQRVERGEEEGGGEEEEEHEKHEKHERDREEAHRMR